MWNNSEFAGSGGFDAGGFDSPGKGGAEKKGGIRNSKAQHLVPVSCSMLTDLIPQQEGVRIGAHDVQQITVVGMVKSCQRDNLSINYVIDDTTGSVKVRQWTEADADVDMAIENSNVRVIGTMKNFQGESVLNCYSIRPVSDPNEVSCHMLEVAYAKLYYQKDVYAKKLALLHAGSTNFRNDNQFGGDVKPPVNGSFSYAPHQIASVPSGPQGLQGQLYGCLKLVNSESGMSIHELARRTNVPLNKVRSAMDELCSEGLAYTTMDDDHFATTDQMY